VIELMGTDQEEFSRRFRESPVKRAKRRGLLWKVAVALGNWGSPEAVQVLARALEDDEPLIRGHAGWALGRIASGGRVSAWMVAQIDETMTSSLLTEADDWVRKELPDAYGS
jgi:epoxyqueuosine reductase